MLRIQAQRGGQTHLAAHVLGPGRGRIQARDNRGAGGRADGGIRPRVPIADAALGEAVEVRRVRVFVTITTELRPDVLGGEPENVGARPGIGGANGVTVEAGDDAHKDEEQCGAKRFHGCDVCAEIVRRRFPRTRKHANERKSSKAKAQSSREGPRIKGFQGTRRRGEGE